MLNQFKKIKNKNLIKKIKTIKIKKIIIDSLKLNSVKKNLSFSKDIVSAVEDAADQGYTAIKNSFSKVI